MQQGPIVTFPQPHADWGLPTPAQLRYLQDYVAARGPMSIYGDEGIFATVEGRLTEAYGRRYCILTNSGTSALSSAYFGLGIQAGDEVIVPTYTFLATATPLLRLGARIVFCDADPETGNISPADLARKLSPRTKAVAITHLWGVPCDMDAIRSLLDGSAAKLVEDCSHAHFTRYNGQLLGTFGDVSCFSMGAKKTMTVGEGGFLLTQNPEVYARATLLGHFALRAEQSLERVAADGSAAVAAQYRSLTAGFGEKYRIHPYAAVMANALLETGELFSLLAKRRSSLRYFEEVLKAVPGIEPPLVDENYYTGAMYGFKARITAGRTAELPALVAELRRRNLSVKLPDSQPLHLEAVFQGASMGPFPGAAEYLRGRISLPTFSDGIEVDRAIIDEYGEVLAHVLRGV